MAGENLANIDAFQSEVIAEVRKDVKEIAKGMNDMSQQMIRMESSLNERLSRMESAMSEKITLQGREIERIDQKTDRAHTRIDKLEKIFQDSKDEPNRKREQSHAVIKAAILSGITGMVVTGTGAMLWWLFNNTFK